MEKRLKKLTGATVVLARVVAELRNEKHSLDVGATGKL